MAMMKLLAVGLAVVAANVATAENVNWLNAADGDWNTPGNWDKTRVPGAADNAYFDKFGSYTVTSETDVPTVQILGVKNDADVTLNFSTNTLCMDKGKSDYGIRVPSADCVGSHPKLTIASGTITNFYSCRVGAYKADTATLVLTGTNTFISTHKDDYFIGAAACQATLIVTNGATLRSGRAFRMGTAAAGSNAVAIVTGQGTKMSVNGNNGVYCICVGETSCCGTLIAEDGATIEANSTPVAVDSKTAANGAMSHHNKIILRDGASLLAGSSAVVYSGWQGWANTLTVTDATLTAGTLYSGGSGQSNLVTIAGGAHVTVNSHTYIGEDYPAIGNVMRITGEGTVFTNATFDITCGSRGRKNLLEISDGATVVAGRSLRLGGHNDKTDYYGSNNTVRITGSGTQVFLGATQNQTSLNVGKSGCGNTLIVSDGALVTLAPNSKYGGLPMDIGSKDGANSNSVYIVNGGVVTNAGNVAVGGSNGAIGNLYVLSNASHCATGSFTANNWGTNNNVRILDGAKLTCNGFYFGGNNAGVGPSESQISGEGTVVTSTDHFRVGRKAPETKVTIADGAEVWVKQQLHIGENVEATNCCLTVQNAKLCVTNHDTFVVRYGGRLVIEGASAEVMGKKPSFSSGASLEFKADQDGFGSLTSSSSSGFDGSTHIVIDAEEFQRKGGGGDFTLLTSGGNMSGTPSVEVRGKGVTYELGARTLTCHVPRIGLMILLK